MQSVLTHRRRNLMCAVSLITALSILSTPLLADSVDALPGYRDETHVLSDEANVRRQLLQVSMAREPADLLISNVAVLNVFTGQCDKAQDIVISG